MHSKIERERSRRKRFNSLVATKDIFLSAILNICIPPPLLHLYLHPSPRFRRWGLSLVLYQNSPFDRATSISVQHIKAVELQDSPLYRIADGLGWWYCIISPQPRSAPLVCQWRYLPWPRWIQCWTHEAWRKQSSTTRCLTCVRRWPGLPWKFVVYL